MLSRLNLAQDDLTPDQQLNAIQIEELYAANEEEFPKDFPLSYAEIGKRQLDDPELQDFVENKQNEYTYTTFNFGDSSFDLITKHDKIVLPTSLQRRAVQWYHETLLHPGLSRTELTMAQHYTWKGMHSTIE